MYVYIYTFIYTYSISIIPVKICTYMCISCVPSAAGRVRGQARRGCPERRSPSRWRCAPRTRPAAPPPQCCRGESRVRQSRSNKRVKTIFWPYLTVKTRFWPYKTVTTRFWPHTTVRTRFWPYKTDKTRFWPDQTVKTRLWPYKTVKLRFWSRPVALRPRCCRRARVRRSGLHFIFEVIWWTGLEPWEFNFPGGLV